MKIEAAFFIALICVLLSTVLKKQNSEYALLLSLAAGALILVESLFSAKEVISALKSIIPNASEIEGSLRILLKALSVSLITQFVSDTCLDAGEKALSSRIEFFGKVSVLLISLPFFASLASFIFELLGE